MAGLKGAQALSTAAQREEVLRRFREETPYWAEHVGKIVEKNTGDLIPFTPKPEQLRFDAELEAQRAAGQPMRGIALKARQIGISTWTQGKLIQRCTQRGRYDAVVVAHDRETGGKLYRMGETLYANLPEDPELALKPAIGQHRRQRFLHFTSGDREAWTRGETWPDSRYWVDTAGEFQSGRGGTYRAIHASEVAFWDQIGAKLAALKNAVPKDPETLFVIESTANGFNEFKDLWDDAEQGRSGYIAFFSPWFEEATYRLRFLNEAEMESFIVGDPEDPRAEEEPDLTANFGLDLEQLNWRRHTISDECNGDIRSFHQEYPSTPEEAFISTGQKVFDPYRLAQITVEVELTDPKIRTPEAPGPLVGDFKGQDLIKQPTRVGEVEVPQSALWVPREQGAPNYDRPWKVWLEPDQMEKPSGEYVIGVDISGGKMETTSEPDAHAIEVIDHKTREQVAEYHSRIDPSLLTMKILLAALFFNNAWVAVERTGGWGWPVLKELWFDFHYPFTYRSRKSGATSEKQESRLGWDTNVRTKPQLVAGMKELIRINEHGVKSRLLLGEMRSYVSTEKGTTEAEPGRYDDALMAYMIAQEVASGTPFREPDDGRPPARHFTPRESMAGYDTRFAPRVPS